VNWPLAMISVHVHVSPLNGDCAPGLTRVRCLWCVGGVGVLHLIGKIF
jgi:hypothetical protein